MKLEYALTNESYKHEFGSQFDFSKKNIRLIAAKNDWAAFQILIASDSDITVSISKNTYFSPYGYNAIYAKYMPPLNLRLDVCLSTIIDAKIQVFPVGMVDDDDGISKSDILLNDETVFVPYKRIQPFWTEITIPDSCKAGLYNGKVFIYRHTQFSDEELVDTLEFQLEIKDVLMPCPKDYSFHLDLWQHLSNIARKHEVRRWSDEHFFVLESYVKALAELGQKAVSIVASEIPWSGQGCYKETSYLSDLFEYNMIKITKDVNGSFKYDFSAVKRYINLCGKYGIKDEIEVFGLANIWTSEENSFGGIAPDYPDAIRLRYLDESDGCYKFMCDKESIVLYIKALEDFFIKEGLIDKVLIAADEPPDIEKFKICINLLKQAAPSFNYKAAINHAGFIEAFNSLINDFVPIFNVVCSEWDLIDEMRKLVKGRLLWYVCCLPSFPNTFIRSPLLESRLIGILTAFMGFNGFLRWNYTAWPENPRTRLAYAYPAWPSGETNFVYPGNNGKPLLSLRYKHLKRGIEDFELIKLVKKQFIDFEAKLKNLWPLVIKIHNLKNLNLFDDNYKSEAYSLEYEDYVNFRAGLLDLLSNA
ncbi:MAG: DUF4091 domain-containing protein [Clostridia bacterium]|nr:DUF4091 domain-containing protein [Clostridia bacterium]